MLSLCNYALAYINDDEENHRRHVLIVAIGELRRELVQRYGRKDSKLLISLRDILGTYRRA